MKTDYFEYYDIEGIAILAHNKKDIYDVRYPPIEWNHPTSVAVLLHSYINFNRSQFAIYSETCL